MQASQKAWTSLWSCSWGFWGLQILHIQDHYEIGCVSGGCVPLPETYFCPTHFSHLDGRSFSRRLSFHLSSQQLSLLLFSLIMSEKKLPGTPCTCFVANASSSDIPHCGGSCNQKYLQSCCWSRNFGSDSLLFPAFGFATSPKTSTVQTCSKPPLLVFRPWPINRLIYHKHHTVNGRNHFALSSRTIYACQFFDSCRLQKNVNQPLELQLGLLGPANSAHPRSQSNRMCTLAGLYYSIILYYIMSYLIILYYIILYHISIYSPYTLQPPRQQEFQLASQLSPIATKKNTVLWIICHFQRHKFS